MKGQAQGKALENQEEFRAKVSGIVSPKIRVQKLDNFLLEKIPALFKIPDWERIKADHHVDQIKKAIAENHFYDPYIRVFRTVDKHLMVIDGQHRLAALWLLHRYYNLKTYDLVLLEYQEDDAVEIYRRLNAGKPLSLKNYVKTFDNGQDPFFNQLRDILSHDDCNNFWDFASALKCLYFAKTGGKNAGKGILQKVLLDVKQEDIDFVREFVKGIKLTMTNKQRGQQFKPAFLKPCFAVAYQYKLNMLEICKLIDFGLTHKDIIDHIDVNTKPNYADQVNRFKIGVNPDA